MKPIDTTSPETGANVPGAAAERRSSGWDIRNAPRNYAALVIYQAGSALLSFGAVWIITRYLGSEGYGGIIAIIAASQVAQVLVNWTSIAVVRFGVDEFIETEKISRTFWLRFLILAVNLALVGALSAFWFPPLASWLKLDPATFWLVLAHFAVTAIWIHVQMGLQAAKLLRMQGLLQMIERLLIFAGVLALTAAARLTPTWAIVCYIVAPSAVMLFGTYGLRRYILTRFTVDATFLRKFVTYSLPLFPFSLVGYFSGSYVDAVFVSKFLSTSDLGVYSVATQVNGIALQLPTLVNTILLPLLVSLQRNENQRSFYYFRHVLPTLTLLWGLGSTAMAFVAYFAIPIFFGEKFSAAGIPLWILLAATTMGIPIAIGYSALSNATSATYVSMVAAVLSSVTNIAANFVLIPRFGLVGCAAATAAAFFISVTTFAALLRRDTKMPLSWIYVSFLPCIAGTIAVSLINDALFGMAVCAAGSFLIAYLYKDSLSKTWSFRENFRRA